MLEITFGRLYERIGSWQPPGNPTGLTCRRCFQTAAFRKPALAGLPHEVLHPFIAELEGVIARRYIDLTEEHEAGRSDEELDGESDEARVDRLAATAARAEREVLDALDRREREITVIRSRLEARLDDYVREQVVRLVGE